MGQTENITLGQQQKMTGSIQHKDEMQDKTKRGRLRLMIHLNMAGKCMNAEKRTKETSTAGSYTIDAAGASYR